MPTQAQFEQAHAAARDVIDWFVNLEPETIRRKDLGKH